MSTLLLVGLNHRTAPVEVREKLHFSPEGATDALHALACRLTSAQPAAAVELALLSTCNRTEIYVWTDSEFGSEADAAGATIAAFLAEHSGRILPELEGCLFTRTGLAAARHLMAVAAGLDSIVTGENEILRQVKEAYELALACKTAGATISALFRGAIGCGKRVRSETEIGCLRRSVATVVVDLALELFPNLENRTALLIGAGKISAMTARGLTAAGLRCILVANRTYERAVKLAATFGGQAVHFDALPQTLKQADIVICSTGAPHIVLHAETVRQAIAGRDTARPLLVADLAVPRDADPAIATLPGVRLVDIDGLEDQVQAHLPLAAEVRECVEAIVDAETESFAAWLRGRSRSDLIRRLQEQADVICAEQVSKTTRRLGGIDEEGRKALEAMARAVAAHILHAPIQYVKTNSGEKAEIDVDNLVGEIFDLS